MTSAQLHKRIVADNLRFMTITPAVNVCIEIDGEFHVFISWHSPSLNLAWYPIIEIQTDDGKTVYNREGAESSRPFCTAWNDFLFDAADFLEGVTA